MLHYKFSRERFEKLWKQKQEGFGDIFVADADVVLPYDNALSNFSLQSCDSFYRYCFPFGRPEGALKSTLSLLERVMNCFHAAFISLVTFTINLIEAVSWCSKYNWQLIAISVGRRARQLKISKLSRWFKIVILRERLMGVFCWLSMNQACFLSWFAKIN